MKTKLNMDGFLYKDNETREFTGWIGKVRVKYIAERVENSLISLNKDKIIPSRFVAMLMGEESEYAPKMISEATTAEAAVKALYCDYATCRAAGDME